MDYENYMELYEAVYFFSRIHGKFYKQLNSKEIIKLALTESTYNAVTRILIVNNFIDLKGEHFILKNKDKYQYILTNVINKNENYYIELYNKAINKSQFFFNNITETEYEIYSRYNFELTFELGKHIAKYLNLENKKVLELGGNSGGLATAILEKNKNCVYEIVDNKIPCIIGNELKEKNHVDIIFTDGDIFELKLLTKSYDYIIIMNLLHDFNDEKCFQIISKYSHISTKFIIIEDILLDEFKHKEVIMHGLRLSVECRGGKQRTIKELENLFLKIDYKLENIIKLNNIHTMLVMDKI